MNPMFAFFVITLIAFTLPMVALRLGREWLVALVPIYLITGNVFATSIFPIFAFESSLAIPIYATTFLITDTLSEHYGKSTARKAVFIGLAGQVVFLVMMLLILNSAIPEDKLAPLQAVFAIFPRLVAGSIVAYFVSQIWDVQVFHALKQKFPGKKTLWMRNLFSTTTSQGLDSLVFLAIAFAGTGYLNSFWGFFFATWIVKTILAMLDTPFIYYSYRIIGKRKD